MMLKPFAKWEPLVIFRNKKVYTGLVSEFYCNMGVGKRVNDTIYLTFVVYDKPILIDYLMISSVLHVDPQVTSLPRIDITKEFTFNVEEHHLFISTVCRVNVRESMFTTDVPISSDHFLPHFQVIATILRANVLPKMTPDKLFGFVELKMM